MFDGGEAEICRRVGSGNFFLWSTRLKPLRPHSRAVRFLRVRPELRGAVGLVADGASEPAASTLTMRSSTICRPRIVSWRPVSSTPIASRWLARRPTAIRDDGPVRRCSIFSTSATSALASIKGHLNRIWFTGLLLQERAEPGQAALTAGDRSGSSGAGDAETEDEAIPSRSGGRLVFRHWHWRVPPSGGRHRTDVAPAGITRRRRTQRRRPRQLACQYLCCPWRRRG